MKLKITLCFLLLNAIQIFAQDNAQYQAVILNYDKGCFGDNKPLPVGKYFVINGAVRSDISYVEAVLYSAGRSDRSRPLHIGNWKRNIGAKSAALFNVPMNYQLIGDANYDVLIQYFREATPQERNKLRSDAIKALDAYVDQSLEAIFARQQPDDRSAQIINDMNNIARKGMSLYRNRQDVYFKGFSDIARGKLRQLMDSHPAGAQRKGIDNATSAKRRNMLNSEFKTIAHSEIESFLSTDLFINADRLLIRNYPTEGLKNPIGLNIGFAAAIVDGTATPANYGIAPYIGLSYPILRKSNSEILRTLSASAGIYLTGVKDNNSTVLTGPFLRAPVYAGIGIKPVRLLRINIGMVALNQELAGEKPSDPTRTITLIRPMIGAALEFDFSLNNKNSLKTSDKTDK